MVPLALPTSSRHSLRVDPCCLHLLVSASKETEFLSLPRYTVQVDLAGLSTKVLVLSSQKSRKRSLGFLLKTKEQVVRQELEKGVLHTCV